MRRGTIFTLEESAEAKSKSCSRDGVRSKAEQVTASTGKNGWWGWWCWHGGGSRASAGIRMHPAHRIYARYHLKDLCGIVDCQILQTAAKRRNLTWAHFLDLQNPAYNS